MFPLIFCLYMVYCGLNNWLKYVLDYYFWAFETVILKWSQRANPFLCVHILFVLFLFISLVQSVCFSL